MACLCVDGVVEGDRESFVARAASAQHRLLRTAVLLTGDHHRAEELVQEALTQVAPRWSRLSAEQPTAYAGQTPVRDRPGVARHVVGRTWLLDG
jgi:DNA-directed RNA polymerase specialized sigma24 family protein